MNDLISVIVPVYNVEKYLNRCIDSIINQTYKNLEIILIDDGSTDNSGKICDEYALKDNRIKVIHKENGGLSDARNKGIEVSTGDYISFIDSDDFVNLCFIEILYRELINNNSDICECKYLRFKDEVNVLNNTYYRVDSFTELKYCKDVNDVVVWNKIYKRCLFDNIRFPINRIHEDEFTTYKLFFSSKKITIIDLPLYYYYFNVSGITLRKIDVNRLDALDAFTEAYYFYRSNGFYDISSQISVKIFWQIVLWTVEDKSKFINYRIFIKGLKSKYKSNFKILWAENKKLYQKLWLLLGLIFLKSLRSYDKITKFLVKVKNRLLKGLRDKKERKLLKKEIISKQKNGKVAFILGSVDYKNFGDQAICLAERKFIENKLAVVEIHDCKLSKCFDCIKKFIRDCDLIVIPGGGNMGNVWINDESRRRKIIQNFPNNKIIVFPQSIYYTNNDNGKESLKISQKIYSNHKDLVLCARDKISFDLMKQYYPNCKVVMVPDIVLSLDCIKCDKDFSALFLFRNDSEKNLDLCNGFENIKDLLRENNLEIKFSDTTEKGNLSKEQRELKVFEIIEKVGRNRIVITDRLHGMIFCVLTKTPCIVFSNYNHKIKSLYETYLKDLSYIKFFDNYNYDNVSLTIKDLINIKYFEDFNFKEMFSPLEEIINE